MKNRAIAIINKSEDIFLVVMFMGMVATIFLQVIMRYVFNNSLVWSEELGKFIFVWISWIGISIGARRKEHIKITMLVDRLPYRANRIIGAFTELVLIAISGVTIYYGIIMVQTQLMINYAGIKISTSWGYMALVIGCSMFLLRTIVNLVEQIREAYQGEPEVDAVEGGQ